MIRKEIESALVAACLKEYEDTRAPDAIAAYADRRQGKHVTVRDAEALSEELGLEVRIRKACGMTQVCWAQPGEAHAPQWGMTLAHAITGVCWPDGATLRAKEPAFFEARDTRNAQRDALLESERVILKRAATLIETIRNARTELDALAEYGEPLYIVSTTVTALAYRKAGERE